MTGCAAWPYPFTRTSEEDNALYYHNRVVALWQVVIAITNLNLSGVSALCDKPFGAVLADPPWRFANRTSKVSPEHKRLFRYETMDWNDIASLPVGDLMANNSHCYLWVPNALIREGLDVLQAWGFTYKSMLVWYKIRQDGGPDGSGVGFYFRNVTELVLFGVRGRLRTLPPGRRQVNLIATCKREHSRKPEELYRVIEACSPGPFLELFARHSRQNWISWGDEVDQSIAVQQNEEQYVQQRFDDLY